MKIGGLVNGRHQIMDQQMQLIKFGLENQIELFSLQKLTQPT